MLDRGEMGPTESNPLTNRLDEARGESVGGGRQACVQTLRLCNAGVPEWQALL